MRFGHDPSVILRLRLGYGDCKLHLLGLLLVVDKASATRATIGVAFLSQTIYDLRGS